MGVGAFCVAASRKNVDGFGCYDKCVAHLSWKRSAAKFQRDAEDSFATFFLVRA